MAGLGMYVVASLLGQAPVAAAPAPTVAPAPAAPVVAEAAPKAVEAKVYGLVNMGLFYNSRPVSNVDVPTNAGVGNDGAVGASARQSRLGVDVALPAAAKSLGAKSLQAKIETDFFGGYMPGNSNTFFSPIPRLRIFRVEAAFENVKFLAGQDWMLFSPVNPDSLNHVSIPGFAGAGNLWARLPQFRVEASAKGFTAGAAVLAPADASAAGTDAISAMRQPSAGDKSRSPSLQGRVAYAQAFGTSKATLGFGGHYGQERVQQKNAEGAVVAEADEASYAVGTDLVVALPAAVTFKGEAYLGADLDGFLSNATLSGVTGATPVGSKAQGGWAQLGYKPGRLGLFAGAGFENVKAPEGATLAANAVTRNANLYAGATWTFTPGLTMGVEANRLETKRNGTGKRVANHYNLTTQLTF